MDLTPGAWLIVAIWAACIGSLIGALVWEYFRGVDSARRTTGNDQSR